MSPTRSSAQSTEAPVAEREAAAAAEGPPGERLAPPTRWPGATAHVVANNGAAYRVDLATGRTLRAASLTRIYTDVAVCPDGLMYAATFTDLYRLAPGTMAETRVGSFGNPGINALACDRNNRLFAASSSTSFLYGVNRTNGTTTTLARIGTRQSAGDLVFHEGALLLSTEDGKILFLDRQNYRQLRLITTGIPDMYGLVSVGPGELYGFSKSLVYRINPLTGASQPVIDLMLGIGAVYGSTFNGNFR